MVTLTPYFCSNTLASAPMSSDCPEVYITTSPSFLASASRRSGTWAEAPSAWSEARVMKRVLITQKQERAPEGARPDYSFPLLERIADADGEVVGVRAGVEGDAAVVVVGRGDAVVQVRVDRVHERLAVEAVACAERIHVRAQAGRAAGCAARQTAGAFARLDNLTGEAPRSEAPVDADGHVGVL